MTPMLGAVLRGLRSRALLSVGSLVLMVLALASAVLGPSFATAVTNSYAVTRLQEALPATTGLTWLYTPASEADPRRAAEQARAVVQARLEGPWGEPAPIVQGQRVSALGGLATFAWREDACEVLDVDGRCPQAPREALMHAADLERAGGVIGDEVRLDQLEPGVVKGVYPRAGFDTVTVVGTYTVPEGTRDWLSPTRLSHVNERVTAAEGLQPYVSAPIFTVPETVAQAGTWQVLVETWLHVPADLSAADLDAAIRTAASVPKPDGEGTSVSVEGGTLVDDGINELGAVAAEVDEQRATAQKTIAPAVLSLVLVALALLMRLLTAASELRMPELALASLRGLTSRRLWFLGLFEPLLLLLVATPLGVAAGLAASLGLVRAWLVPGLPLPVPPLSWVALALVLSAAVAVACVAVGLVVTTTLSSQLAGVRRPRASKRWALVGQLVLVSATVAVLASKLSAGGQSEPDVSDLVLPVLLAVVAGLLATRVVAWVAGWLTRRSAGGGRSSLAGFVASRAVARRQEGTLVVLPVTAAIAVAVFGIGVYDAAATWRTSVAATRSPGDVTWASPLSLTDTMVLTRQIDPDGDYLMTAADVSNTGGNFAVVDSSRLERVARWPHAWSPDLDVATVAERLRTPGEVPIIEGRRLAITVDNQLSGGTEVKGELRLGLHGGEEPRRVYTDAFGPGTSTVTVELPDCATGCPFEGFTLGGGAGTTTAMDGTLVVEGFAVDGTDVDLIGDAAWGVTPGDGVPSNVVDVREEDGQLVIETSDADGAGMARMTSGGLPQRRPAYLGEVIVDRVVVDLSRGETGVPIEPEGRLLGMPFVGRAGILIDATAFANDRQYFDTLATTRVVMRDDTPRAMRDALTGAGMTVETTLDAERAVLDQGAYALALRLYAVVAALALLTALAGVAVSNAMQVPSRRRDAASLRVVGVPRRAILGSVVRELSAVLGGAAVAGVAAGTLAQWVVLQSLTLGQVEQSWVPQLVVELSWGRAAVMAVAACAVFALLALVAASATVRGARGASLRESAR